MGRWTQFDEDEYRLPEGMKRVGYDADTQRYTFQKGNELWLGEPGAEYGGNLTRAGTVDGHHPGNDDDDDVEAGPVGRADGYQPLAQGPGARPVDRSSQSLLPFIVLIGVFLLFTWRLIVGHSPHISGPSHCPTANSTYRVEKGDSCWSIANQHETTVDRLQNQTLNPGLDCDRLRPGDVLCLPLPK